MVITGTTMNFKLAPIFDRLMALFRNDEYISFLYMGNAIFDEFLA